MVLRAGLCQHPRCHARNVTNIHEREARHARRHKDAVPTHQFIVQSAGEVLHEVGRPQQRVLDAARHQAQFDLVVRDQAIAFRALHRQEHDVRDAVVPRTRDQVPEVAVKVGRTQQKEAVTFGQRSVLASAASVPSSQRASP